MAADNSRAAIDGRRHENEARQCTTLGCHNLRFGFNSTCTPCTTRKNKLGAASAKRLARADYANEWAAVKKFCHRFRDHPRIIEGTATLQRWLSAAQLGKAVPGRDAVAKLADKGAQPEMVLIEILSVALHASTHDNPATRAPLLYANAMLRGIKGLKRGPQAMSRHGKRPKGYSYYSAKDRRAMQREIVRTFGSTMYEMIEHFKRAEEIRNAEIAAKAKEGPRPFINMCSRCEYNARKAAEKRTAREADPVKAKENERRWKKNALERKEINGEA